MLIVIVSYNSIHLMKECIKSIRDTVEENTYQIIVVDNASTDGVAEWLETQKDIILIKNSENVGFGPACNQAVEATNGTKYENSDVFLLNNDTRLIENSLNNLKRVLYSSDDIGAVGSVSNYAGNKQQIDVLFDRVEEYVEYGRKNNEDIDDDFEERVRLSGFAMLIRRDVWNKVGGFDEDFAPGYFEDDALAMEILKHGYRLMLVKNSFIYHAGSQSFIKIDYNKLLEDHRRLFEEKYGFDIIDHAYSDEAVLSEIPYTMSDAFRLLQVGCGLGADLKAARVKYPKCDTVGIETNRALYDFCKCTEKVFDSVDSLEQAINKGYFDVLLLDDNAVNELSHEDKERLVGLCKPEAVLLKKYKKYQDFPYENIKLIIWDMDDTFWTGIISETDVDISTVNSELIKVLTDHGIINSISSKNDEMTVKERLTREGLWDLFVFNNINWEEKGLQLAEKLKIMGLRAENTLFIDDSQRNLEEALFSNPGLMTAGPEIIPYLIDYYSKITPHDIAHNRLEQYRLLERKTKATAPGISKEQFLHESNIIVTINKNCLEELDRIHELVMRTNQLNYTKHRDDKSLLTRLLTNDWNDCAYIKVHDRFGDYGIIGFYCYNTREKSMEHFLFSCRVLGMGIEQYVYNKLGCPGFAAVEPVAVKLGHNRMVPWIKEAIDEEVFEDKITKNRVRVLLKGPCDMSAIEPYLAGANITTEFNYVNDMGFVTTGQNHSAHLRESLELSKEEIDSIVKDVPFIIEGDFATKLFTEKYHVICYSLLQDLSAGLYRNKETGVYVSFSSRNFDLTDIKNTERFIKKEIQSHDFDFSEEIITRFKSKWEFIGNTPLDMLLDNLEYIYENVPGKPLIILILGSMMDYNGYNEEFDGLCEIYREINPVIEAFAEDHERIKIIDPTPFIRSQDDFEDCINHFSRNVYYEMAGKISEYINEYIESGLARK